MAAFLNSTQMGFWERGRPLFHAVILTSLRPCTTGSQCQQTITVTTATVIRVYRRPTGDSSKADPW